MLQPGMMQPGMQPGMMQPGMQPGMMQPGMQPGMMQPGMQPGMMQPGMMTPGMMPPQGQTIVIENEHIEKTVSIKVAFWNKKATVKAVRGAMCFAGSTICLAGIIMIVLIAMATSSATIEASGIMQIKSDWGTQPYT
jgi:hypothetical protein